MRLLFICLFLSSTFIAQVSSESSECKQCKFIVELLHDEWGSKTTSECVGDAAIFICDTLHIEDNFICNGLVSVFKDEFIYVLGQIIVTPNEICGLLVEDCGNPYDPLLVKWRLPMPPNQPPFEPKKPVSDGKPVLRVLHLTDIHLDMFYTPGLEADCPTSQCCRPQDIPDEVTAEIKRPAGKWGMVGNCDAPYWLFTNMLDNIAANNGKLDYIIVSGDITSHTDWAYSNITHMAMIRNVSDSIRSRFPAIPVIFSVGNHEGVPIDNIAPHYTPKKYHMDWLFNSMAESWKGWVPDDQNKTIRYNGCYMVKLYPGLRVISLNNVYGDRINFWLYINETDPDGSMSWLISQLKDAEAAGDKVHIVSHINGGDGESLEGWDINYYNVVNRFANTISAQFFGHTHYEAFYMIYMDPENHTSQPTNIVYSAPSLTPYNEFYPAYRIYTIDGNYASSTYQVIDFGEWYFNLTENNANSNNPTWKPLYESVNKEYDLQSHIPDEWNKMIERMKTDDELFAKYRKNYYRRNQYDGVKECDKFCRDEMICKTRKFHHTIELCKDLHVLDTGKKKNRLYRKNSNKRTQILSAGEIRRKQREWKKGRDSQNCPL